jgi:hypothetical protein
MPFWNAGLYPSIRRDQVFVAVTPQSVRISIVRRSREEMDGQSPGREKLRSDMIRRCRDGILAGILAVHQNIENPSIFTSNMAASQPGRVRLEPVCPSGRS